MKQIITIAFLFLALSGYCQQKTTGQYVEKIGDNWYYTVVLVNPTDTVRYLRDSADYRRELVAKAESIAEQYVQAIEGYWALQNIEGNIGRFSEYLEQLTGKTAFELSVDKYGQQAAGNWQVSTNGGDTWNNAVMEKSGSTLTLTVGQNQYNVLIFLDKLIRVQGFQGGTNLIRIGASGLFLDESREIQMRKL